MSGKRTILRDRGPPVGPYLCIRLTGIDHRFDGQNHTFLQPRILVLTIHVIGDLRLFMQLRTDPVAYKLAHDSKTVLGNIPLDRSTHIEEAIAGSDLIDGLFERLLGDRKSTRLK